MDRNEQTDADLVARSLAGEREAFVCLYDHYAPMVRAVVVGVSGDWDAVEDMTQESFLRAYRQLAKLRDPSRFGAWLVGIARRVARERKRSLRRDRHRFVGERLPDLVSPEDAASRMQDADERDLLMKKLSTLPERERLAIHAFFLQQQRAPQAAELLELSRSGFYALLGRALSHLAALVGHREPEEETKT